MTQPYMFVFDVETSGLSFTDSRVVQFAGGVYDSEGNELEFHEIFIDPGVEIPVEASDIHGFTTEWLKENGGNPEEELGKVLQLFRDNWGKVIFVAYNASFDISMLNAEFKRHGLAENWGGIMAARAKIFDPMVVDRAKDRYRKGKRTLEAVSQHFGLEFDPEAAHNARYDVEMTAKVAIEAIKRYGFQTNAQQAQMHKAWADNFKQYLIRRDPEADISGVSGDWPLRT